MADGIVFIIEGGHYYVMALIVAAFIVCLTEFTSNTASAALLVPIFISIAQALNMPPLGFCDDYRPRSVLCLYDAGRDTTKCDCVLDRFC